MTENKEGEGGKGGKGEGEKGGEGEGKMSKESRRSKSFR